MVENIICYVIIGTFVCYFVHEIFFKKEKTRTRKKDKSRILFNAHIETDMCEEEELFRKLEDNNLSFNYLENEIKSN